MTTRTINGTQRSVVFAFLLALSVSSAVLAQEHGHGQGGFVGHGSPERGGVEHANPEHGGFEHGSPERGGLEHGNAEHGAFAHGGLEHGEHQHIDTHFSHNHYYFDHGYRVHEAPQSGHEIQHEHEHFWYDRGQWYRRDGRGWLVVGAPVGAFVADLPPFYTTIWFGGVPYYYADDTYYTWSGDHNEYEVVEPPAGIENASTPEAPTSDSIFIYPKNGQSPEQQASDRYECHHSAVEQTGYDPTQAGGGVPSAVAASKRSDYFRAETACLDAHGYSVR